MGSLNVKVKLSSCFNINIRSHVTHDFLSLAISLSDRPTSSSSATRPPPSDTVARHNSPTKVADRVSLSHITLNISPSISLPLPSLQAPPAQPPSSPPISKPTPLCAWTDTFACVPPPLPESWFLKFEVIRVAVQHGKRNFGTFLVGVFV